MAVALKDLALAIGAQIVGADDITITGIAPLHCAQSGELSFLANSRYRKYLAVTNASAVIINNENQQYCKTTALVVKDPYLAYARAAAFFIPDRHRKPGIHASAIIDDDAVVSASASIGPHTTIEAGVHIGDNVEIGPGCYIAANSHIGKDGKLVANVTVGLDTLIGDRVLIHPGVVIGSDGFGFANDGQAWIKIPQLGRVVIGDDVEIGANTTIDRGALEDTIIEDGVKLDNQIQVGHNVIIGANTAIAACTGIAGSTRIGKNCAIGGGVGILGHLVVADRVQITAMSLVTKSLTRPGTYSSGTPLEESQRWHKNYVRFKQLDEMARHIKELEKKLQKE